MVEPELPITLTFANISSANNFVVELEQAKEDIIWEQSKSEDGSVMVRILNITSLEEEQEQEDME